jgi:hypothetical protein
MKEARNLKSIKAAMKIDFVISEKRDAAEISTGRERKTLHYLQVM